MRLIDRSLVDYLTANEKWRRTLRLSIQTETLLRQGGGRLQARKQAGYLAEARNQIGDQMRTRRRRAFRGEVSVSVTIFASGVALPPSAPKTVKRYLDALTGLAYKDDEQIAHLQVERHADDHPYQRRMDEAERSAPIDGVTRDRPWVSIAITPARIYRADYDRAFRIRDDHDLDWERDRSELRFWEGEDEFDDDELEELLDERADDAAGRGIYGLLEGEDLEVTRRVREMLIDRALSKRILGRRPTIWDRPGPSPFADVGDVAPHPQAAQRWRLNLAGELWLPGPEEAEWKALVRERMSAHRAHWKLLPSAFDEPLALDIAAHGAAGLHRDVDNLAHPILAMFERLYCADRRGTVTGYRAYRVDTEVSGVRVQVMPAERLPQLRDAIDSARSYVLSRGPRSGI